MIERKFISQINKELAVKEYIRSTLRNVGLSDIRMIRTPIGEKIIVKTSRPGIVVGRGGSNIATLSAKLKEDFKLENPQIEIEEVKNTALDAQIVAETITSSLERFGPQRFKAIGHKMMAEIMHAGAMGVEILISGKIPSSRAKVWRFYQGYIKKCGDIAVTYVLEAKAQAQLKTGVVGVQVRIMPPDIKLPDAITILGADEPLVEEVPLKKEKKKSPSKETKKEKATEKAEVTQEPPTDVSEENEA
ncbi:MAG: 30S ribosomal protein S3 [Candidatus Woesearchaeota archaeon]|nr:MAG: 30S ribosomal protein S3 [Candidatus Woesearchaeota archaeon]